MERILFVDENRDVLEGYKRVLFKMRKEWNMEFVTGGEAALKRLEQAPFRAIVCDAGMSEIRGIELLQMVRKYFPEVARIIVSTNADMKELLEALGTAHRFLVKPVNEKVLQETLLRVMTLMKDLNDKRLLKFINSLQSLPTRPELHLELLQAISTASAVEIAAVIEKDPAMTIKILQLVNSPYFGIREPIKNIYQAVSLLGSDILNGLVLSLEIFSKFPFTGASKRELEEIFNHSTEVANYARVMTLEITGKRELANDAYTGGMIHDVGKLVLLSGCNDDYFAVKERARRFRQPFFQLERELLGVDHSKIGAYLMGLWGLPQILVETAAYHHSPGDYYCREFSPVTAVHLADAVKRDETNSRETDHGTDLPSGIEADCLEKLDIVEKIPAAVTKIYSMK
jgi:HD-like signal output (HDOD) protein